MPPEASKVTIHMAASLDFFIAKKDGTIGWMDTPDSYEKGVGFEAAEGLVQAIDCYVMGARTYEHALGLGWPYGEVPVVVLTHRELPNERASVEFYAGDLAELVHQRLKPRYKNIWLVGGALLTREFLRRQLADDIIIAILPILLGEGTPFVEPVGGEHALHLKDVTAYKNGIVELWYEIKHDGPGT